MDWKCFIDFLTKVWGLFTNLFKKSKATNSYEHNSNNTNKGNVQINGDGDNVVNFDDKQK